MSLSLKARKNLYLVHMNDRPHLTPASSPLTNSTNDKLGGTQPSKQSLLYFLGNLPPAYWQKSQAITFKVYTF